MTTEVAEIGLDGLDRSRASIGDGLGESVQEFRVHAGNAVVVGNHVLADFLEQVPTLIVIGCVLEFLDDASVEEGLALHEAFVVVLDLLEFVSGG